VIVKTFSDSGSSGKIISWILQEIDSQYIHYHVLVEIKSLFFKISPQLVLVSCLGDTYPKYRINHGQNAASPPTKIPQ
jgi:hypothetical protein